MATNFKIGPAYHENGLGKGERHLASECPGESCGVNRAFAPKPAWQHHRDYDLAAIEKAIEALRDVRVVVMHNRLSDAKHELIDIRDQIKRGEWDDVFGANAD